jgi:hypothetical protein
VSVIRAISGQILRKATKGEADASSRQSHKAELTKEGTYPEKGMAEAQGRTPHQDYREAKAHAESPFSRQRCKEAELKNAIAARGRAHISNSRKKRTTKECRASSDGTSGGTKKAPVYSRGAG